MKQRKVESSASSDLIIESFTYGRQKGVIRIDTDDCYEICYILGGHGHSTGDCVSIDRPCGNIMFRANFADKTSSSAVLENGRLTLARCMNLLFFTSPETGTYRIKLDCTALSNATNCNIWYFKGSEDKGYSFIEIDGADNRHDPREGVRQTFPITSSLEKGQSLVLGIGNYWGAVLEIHELSATLLDAKTPCTYYYPESSCFSMFDHPHASASSHREKSGEGFVFEPDHKCALIADPNQNWTHFNIRIKGKNAEKLISKHITRDRLGCFSYSFSERLINLIPILFFSDRPLSEVEATIVLNDILSLQGEGQSVRENPYVETAKAYILRNIDISVKITDIASFIGISDRYLYNLFVKYEGISPKQYMNNVKLERAKKLLSDPEMTITEIAEAMGFTDVLCFSHFFSDHTGTSPSQFKKSCENSMQ